MKIKYTPRGVDVMYMCTRCFRLYNPDKAKEMSMSCAECDKDFEYELVNQLAEIDEPIARDIALMNRKGYITEFCCAGHPAFRLNGEITTNEFYVTFLPIVDEILPWLLKHTPDGMKFDVYDTTSYDECCYKHRVWMGPRMHEFIDDLFDKKVISVDEDGEPNDYQYTGLTLERYNKYEKWRAEIHQFVFHKWVVMLPDLYKKKDLLEFLN